MRVEIPFYYRSFVSVFWKVHFGALFILRSFLRFTVFVRVLRIDEEQKNGIEKRWIVYVVVVSLSFSNVKHELHLFWRENDSESWLEITIVSALEFIDLFVNTGSLGAIYVCIYIGASSKLRAKRRRVNILRLPCEKPRDDRMTHGRFNSLIVLTSIIYNACFALVMYRYCT